MAKTSFQDWDTVAANNTDIDGVNIAENCPAAGINNAIRTVMSQLAVWLAALFASASDLLAGTSTTKAITPGGQKDALAFDTVTAAANVFTPDMSGGVNFTLTLTANATLANIANAIEGYGGLIEVIQDGTGGWTLSKPASGSKYKGPGGFPVVSTAAGGVTTLAYSVRSSGVIYLWPALNMSAT